LLKETIMRSFKALFNLILAVAAISVSAPVIFAQEHHHAGGAEAIGGGHLGQVHFSTSCAPAVQQNFEKGVALLHSFQYSASDQVFKQVAAADPSCAIAYWGQAMTLWHALWERPDAATLKTGHDEVEKAAGLNARTAREREYIAAAAAFFQDDPKLDYAVRAKAYSAAMGKVHERYPDDGEASAFYGLSLISIPAHGDEDLADREQAIAVLNKLFAAEPDHPGAAHYLIHACDTPELAPQGLAAARAYAKIAPGSSHALHMPSHIFSRLGLWQESIDSNIAAAAAAEQATQAHLGEANYQLHAMDFLEYAYLQSGRNADAQHVIDEVPGVPGASAKQIDDHQATFRARYALETHDWKVAAALAPPSGELYAQDTTWWARAIGASRSGDVAGARADIEKLDAATAESKSRSKKEGYEVKDEKSVDQLEAESWLAYAEGSKDEALKTLRGAADREDREGPDDLGIPAREMLGDMLMESGQPEAALAAYQTALKESPNRLDSLHGVELAGKATGREQPAGGGR
jgi:tetratricopeptide (TPR) repeat protein